MKANIAALRAEWNLPETLVISVVLLGERISVTFGGTVEFGDGGFPMPSKARIRLTHRDGNQFAGWGYDTSKAMMPSGRETAFPTPRNLTTDDLIEIAQFVPSVRLLGRTRTFPSLVEMSDADITMLRLKAVEA